MAETRKSLIDQGEQKLKENGISSCRLESEILLCILLGCDREKILSEPGSIVPDEMVRQYRQLIEKRSTRYPFQYLIRKQEFYSLEFYVDERVLIPRPESELIVDELLKNVQTASPRMVDIGTGSGNLAVSAAVHILGATVFAVDHSRAALDVARINAGKHRVSDRVLCIHGHFLECFKTFPEGLLFDAIVSNPPYIRASEMEHLQDEIKYYEPRLSLEAGKDGLRAYREIIPAAYPLLKKSGTLILESGAGMAPDIAALMRKSSFGQICMKKDLQGIERIVAARKD
jgi:release factor glutamine methyltransferase